MNRKSVFNFDNCCGIRTTIYYHPAVLSFMMWDIFMIDIIEIHLFNFKGPGVFIN